MEKKEFNFEVKELDEKDGFFHVYGLANTFDVDLGNDETVKGAFLDSIASLKASAQSIKGSSFKALAPGLWQHDSSMPIGTYVDMTEGPKGLETHAIYPLDDSFVKGRVKPQMGIGSIRKQSIGYIPKEVSFYEDKNRGTVRRLEKIDLKEISLVTFPMNEGAIISDFKAISLIDLDTSDMRSIEDALTKGIKFPNRAVKKLIPLMKQAGLLREEQSVDSNDVLIKELDKILKQIKEF